MTDFEKIGVEIVKAVEVAAQTLQEPGARLRDSIAKLWEQYVMSNCIDFGFQCIDFGFQYRNERFMASGRADTSYNLLRLEYNKSETYFSVS